jgi:hypothetical protein
VTATADGLEVRALREEELPQLLRLWDEAGWGAVSADQWLARHRDGPLGPTRVVVAAEENGTLLGQLSVLPVRLNLRGATLPIARVLGLVMSPTYRRTRGYAGLSRHPVLRMVVAGIQAAAADGAVAAYALPDKRALRVAALAMPTAQRASFPFWSRPIEPVPAMPPGHDIDDAVLPDDLDELWARCRGDLVCTVRDARALAWKSLFASLHLRGIRRKGTLVAVAASRGHGDRQWLVEDVLAVDEIARAASLAVILRTAREEARQRDIRKVGALAVPALQPALAGFHFVDDAFTFHAFVQPLQECPPSAVDPVRWYLTPDD